MQKWVEELTIGLASAHMIVLSRRRRSGQVHPPRGALHLPHLSSEVWEDGTASSTTGSKSGKRREPPGPWLSSPSAQSWRISTQSAGASGNDPRLVPAGNCTGSGLSPGTRREAGWTPRTAVGAVHCNERSIGCSTGSKGSPALSWGEAAGSGSLTPGEEPRGPGPCLPVPGEARWWQSPQLLLAQFPPLCDGTKGKDPS